MLRNQHALIRRAALTLAEAHHHPHHHARVLSSSLPRLHSVPAQFHTFTSAPQPTAAAAPALHLVTRRAYSGPSAAPNKGGVVSFLLTDVGEGIAEVEILKWYVKEGDEVNAFDKVCEVQSDKATVEITSRYHGTVRKIHYPKGAMAKVGSPLVDIDQGTSSPTPGAAGAPPPAAAGAPPPAAGAPPPPPPPAAPTPTPAATAAPGADEAQYDKNVISVGGKSEAVLATPAVRRLARELRIPLNLIAGSGKDGRVTKEDLVRYSEKGGKPAAPAPTTVTPPVTVDTTPPPQPPTAKPQPVCAAAAAAAAGERTRVEKIRGLRRTMVKTMSSSVTVPQLGYSDEVDCGALEVLRNDLRAIASTKGVKVTYLPIIIKAVSLALKSFPLLNTSPNSDCSEIIWKNYHNIGIAMDTPNGLIVPNVKDCQSKSILQIAAELNRLQQLGKEGKLGAEDLTDGTFTLSNIGAIGGTYASPLLLPPEVCIGALGKLQTVPRYNSKGELVPTKIMCVSWSADHRIVDGANIAGFSNLWKSFLEKPITMLSETS